MRGMYESAPGRYGHPGTRPDIIVKVPQNERRSIMAGHKEGPGPVGVGDLSYSRSRSLEGVRARAGPTSPKGRHSFRLAKSTAVKAMAVGVIISMIVLALLGTREGESVVRTTASDIVFTAPVMVNDNRANVQAAPVIATVPGAELFVAWQDSRSGNEDIYVSRSLDNGSSFSPNKRADDSIVSSKQVEPSVAISENGTIYMAWQDNRRRTFDYDIFFSKSYDGGETFARNLKVDDSTDAISWQERPSIAVTSSGYIYIAWTDDRTGHIRVRGTWSADGGTTFSASEEIVPSGDTSGQAGISLISNGDRIFAAFMDNVSGLPHPYVCISTDGGQSFSPPARLDNTGSAASQRGVSIAPLPGGGIVALWEDSRGGDWDICASMMSSEGDITVADFRVDDDSSEAYQKNAWAATDQLGNVYAIWEDERDSEFAIRFAYLAAGRDSFSASVEVATPGSDDMQRRPSVCSTGPGHVHVSWQDDKAGSYDIYSSAGYVPELDIEIPEFSATLVPVMALVVIAIVVLSRAGRDHRRTRD